MTALVKSKLFWPITLLGVMLIANVILSPGFFSIRMQDGHLYGSLIDILRNGAPLIVIAIGMTLVISTGGIDLSVGALVAIAGAVACTYLQGQPDPGAPTAVATAVAMAIALSLVLGLWNGFLVSVIGIQPIIATLVLMTAGRGLAMLITDGQLITVNSPAYKTIGGGYWATLPVSILIAALVFTLISLLTRRSALGMLIESVGINPEASRLAGVASRPILWSVYVFSALCAGIAGIMISSNVTVADSNNAGLFIEMDAILAVVIGGTSLAGGKFSLTGTLIGALIIQTLKTTVLTQGIAPEITMVFKAGVVIIICLLQSPLARQALSKRRTKTPTIVSEAAAQ